jgi:hypothetical protein
MESRVTVLVLAVSVIGGCADSQQECPAGSVAALLSVLERGSPGEGAHAARALGGLGSDHERVIPALAVAFVDDDATVAQAAGLSLASYWDVLIAREAILGAVRSADGTQRARGAAALGALSRADDTVADLLLGLASDECRRVADLACRSLLAIWDRGQAPGAAERALVHPLALVRQLACLGAAHSGSASAELVARVDDQDPDVRAAAIHAIVSIGDRSEQVSGALVAQLRDREVGEQAACALLRLGLCSDEASASLASRLDGASAALVDMLASAGPRSRAALPELRVLLTIANVQTTLEAAWAIHVISGGSETVVQPLLDTLASGDAGNRVGVIPYLCRFGPLAEDGVPTLTRMLLEEDPDVRRGAALALGFLGPAANAAIPQLHRLLRDVGDAQGSVLAAPRYAAAASLARLGQDGPKIDGLLGHVLAGLGDRSVFGMEEAALRHAWHHGMPGQDVARRVAKWGRGPPDKPLHAMLSMIALLGDIGSDASVAAPWLRRLQSSRYEVRVASTAALRIIEAK